MKRRLWIITMAFIVLGAAKPSIVATQRAHSCVPYICEDTSGCDIGCGCKFIGALRSGTCG